MTSEKRILVSGTYASLGHGVVPTPSRLLKENELRVLLFRGCSVNTYWFVVLWVALIAVSHFLSVLSFCFLSLSFLLVLAVFALLSDIRWVSLFESDRQVKSFLDFISPFPPCIINLLRSTSCIVKKFFLSRYNRFYLSYCWVIGSFFRVFRMM